MDHNIVILVTVLCLSTVIFHTQASVEESKSVYVYHNIDKAYIISDEELGNRSYCAMAVAQRTLHKTGWDVVSVRTQKIGCYTSVMQAYAAGVAEGYLTKETMWNHWQNTMLYDMCPKENMTQKCKALIKFIDDNYYHNLYTISLSQNDPIWYQVNLFYKQLHGLVYGYNYNITDVSKKLKFMDLYYLNTQGDIDELLEKFSKQYPEGEEDGIPTLAKGSRLPGAKSCSALIKLLANSTDLYAAHDTWSSFVSMSKVAKRYDFEFTTTDGSDVIVPGKIITFSSYPGVIQSGDDFYVTSAGLTVMETTTGNNNDSLWDKVVVTNTLQTQIRAMVANRLANSGESWCSIFSKYNMGTYNNQWMVVDYKKFKPGTPQRELKNGLLWVLEQLPGYVKSADKTDVLREQSYWPSYNSPYFPEIFNLSANKELVDKFGDWFTYDKTPRALIFKRDHVTVTDVNSMIALMRYNDYTHDPLSRCNCTPPYSAENAIACRSDLNPANGTYPFPALGHRQHTATDMKMTTSKLSQHLQFWGVSGPPFNENLPAFQWSKSDYNNLPHLGQPDLWQFKPYLFQWESLH